MSKTKPAIYIDTSSLRNMSFYKDLARLLDASKKKNIEIYISETTLWERGRQQYAKDFDIDRLIPYPDDINRYLAWFKSFFENYGVTIIKSSDAIVQKTNDYLQNPNSYFKINDPNDQRDAHVLSTAEVSLEKSISVLCNDGNLADAFEDLAGFSYVKRDAKAFISELIDPSLPIPTLERPSLDSLNQDQIIMTFSPSFQDFIKTADPRFHEYLTTLPVSTNKLDAKLTSLQVIDVEIRKRILGYVSWFAPLGKKELNKLLETREYGIEQIDINAKRLRLENLLSETENNWLPNVANPESKEICDEAMSVLMPEILEIMELA